MMRLSGYAHKELSCGLVCLSHQAEAFGAVWPDSDLVNV